MKSEQLWNKAQNYIKESKFDKALVLLNQMLEIEPKNATVLSERAVIYFRLEDKELALKELDRCVLLEPTNPYRYSSRAYIKASMKDFKGAVQDYEKCIELDPNDVIAYNNLGLVLESLGRMEQAKKRFEKASELEDVLKERGIEVEKPEELVSEDDEKKDVVKHDKEIAKTSTWSIVKGTFSNKKVFKEYVGFIKNGFKLKNGEDE